MADFTARLVGPTIETWVDDDFDGQLRRTNPIPGAPHRRYRTTVGSGIVQARATVGGVDGPTDAALGGRLFMAWFAEHAGAPTATGIVGGTSVQEFTPQLPGHYTFVMSREGGGRVILHLDVLPA
jgi:hypothetical protein